MALLTFKISAHLHPQSKEEFKLIGEKTQNRLILRITSEIFKHIDSSPCQESLNFNSSWAILETHLVLEFPMQWLHPRVLGAEDLGLSSRLPPHDVGKIHLFSVNFFKQREVMKYLFLGV